jgi:asparagine synthase (glutamine-hydrolysing)
MCGIAATFGAHPQVDVARLTDVLTKHLAHRGPDGLGASASGRGVVAHARLSIVDVASGQQPMRSDDGRVILACNGEIYNHRELRVELAPRHSFRSQSDSEVILPLYQECESDFVSRLDGMFAFFLTDGERFLAARDALGIKPLYVGQDEHGGFWFASEIKALIGRCRSLWAVPPGTLMTEAGVVRSWYSPSWEAEVGTRSNVEPGECLLELEKAVVKRLMSDVPLGVLLSGGLDSSIVAALVRRHTERLDTFSVGVEGAPDLEASRFLARALGFVHHECTYSVRDISRRLDEIIYYLESYDAALIRSAVPCYFVSALAAETVKVVLTGEGADELFGGYAHMARIRDPLLLHHECARLLRGLHSMNLQRVDRMTMAHGIEGRVPFLDLDFVSFAMKLDPNLKLRQPRGLEKALLRAAADAIIPRDISQRPKAEFSQGSATDIVLEEYAGARVSDHDFSRRGQLFPVDTPRTKEEMLYRSIFAELFPDESARKTVARWQVPSPQAWLS